MSFGPVSRCLQGWSCRCVASVLARAEAAARYLVIANARVLISRHGLYVDDRQIAACLARVHVTDDAGVPLSDCKMRLRALRALLTNISRHTLRLLRRIAKQEIGALRQPQSRDVPASASLYDWPAMAWRVERPPDHRLSSR